MNLRCSILLLAFSLGAARPGCPQVSPAIERDLSGNNLKISADEVNLTFHAEDAQGLPVIDLAASDVRIYDNGRPPSRVLAFYPMTDAPLRAAFLLDTSESMMRALATSRAIALMATSQILRGPADRAMIMDFAYASNLRSDWSNDRKHQANAIASITTGGENPLPGTALFDAVFRACFYGTGKIDNAAGGNFILLFTDGEDNASRVTLAETVDACQHANTAVYAFRPMPAPGVPSTGPANLQRLADQTGGRVFRADETPAEVADDLRRIEGDLRNEYRLVYKPSDFKHDGKFHQIVLLGPDRAAKIQVRSGYYAPAH